jgi:hypothetical protein
MQFPLLLVADFFGKFRDFATLGFSRVLWRSSCAYILHGLI